MFQGDIGVSDHWGAAAIYTAPYCTAVDPVQQDVPVEPETWQFKEKWVSADTSVPRAWTGNTGRHSG
jgi:hypothetical protein